MPDVTPKPQSQPEDYDALVQELAVGLSVDTFFNVAFPDTDIGRRLLAARLPEQRLIVQAMLRRLNQRPPGPFGPGTLRVCSAMNALLRRRLPLTLDDILALLDWNLSTELYQDSLPPTIKAIERYLDTDNLTPELAGKIQQLITKLGPPPHPQPVRDWIILLKEAGHLVELGLPLIAGEAWADAAIAETQIQSSEAQSAWRKLLEHCQRAAGASPTRAWLKTALQLQEQVGLAAFNASLRRWLALVDKPAPTSMSTRGLGGPPFNALLDPTNADALKGLVWLCAQHEDAALAQAVAAVALSAYRKVPGQGPRSVKLGNACVWALGNMPGRAGLQQLGVVKVRLKLPSVQKTIARAITTAAARVGLPEDEVEEMSAPTYDLSAVGLRREQLGEFTAEVRVKGASSVELNWFGPDGQPRATVPQAVKSNYAAELKALTQSVKDIRNMLPAQRDRLERLYLDPRKWSLPTWRERYLDHPLVGALARRLIWKFTRGDQAASGIWWDEQMEGRDGARLDWLDDQSQVELWHPLQASSEVVLQWRDWLSRHGVQQPFKQAHREIYLLTEAERGTRVYSNRFAAHILRQHQFNALCAARGWRSRLRLMVDDMLPPPTRLLPAWNLRAEYWVEGIGEANGRDTNETGTYLYLSTDQVRFYRINDPENMAHGAGGGYTAWSRREGGATSPLNLEDIPPLVFSEVMRDVDLFVGVASVGNDPTWGNRGPRAPHWNYWNDYSFGALSETARTRHLILEELLPKLKIADRCQLAERFLRVRGDLRTYKIHLGSGNILMEPDDHYLCIVPAQGQTGAGAAGQVYLPFEGDQTLAIILSKAFLLAADKAITDPTIVRQIRR